jgi:hypothetical protein
VWQYRRNWTPFQREYLGLYAATYRPSLFPSLSAPFRLAYRVDKKGRRLATDDDIADMIDHKARLEWAVEKYDKADLRRWLREAIYGGRTPLQKFAGEWPFGLYFFGVGLVWALPKDRKRYDVLKNGRRVRGPELVTAQEFNRRNNSDGIGFFVGVERLVRKPLLEMARIRRAVEAMHVMIAADSGMGKSVAITHLLYQIQERGENAIVYDPTPRHEFVTRFYRPERGDVILNPLDQRMPYWSPADEVSHEAEALTVATSLFQDDRRDNPFFVEGPRKVFAHLLTLKPAPQELVFWLSREEEIDRRLKGTPLASLVYASAPQQRGGILAALSMVANSLSLLPRKEEAQGAWSSKAWAAARERKGWIFITSLPEYRAPLKPLISLWLDLLVLRLMNDVAGERPATWFVLDELASLQRLPQLLTAVTENRKSGNPVVLGFQGRSQIEARYGREAEALFSQPATKLLLRTSEPMSAEWIGKTIGDVEMERRRKSETKEEFPKRGGSQGQQDERRTEPLVMASEIMGLDQLHGYLKHGNLVVPVRLFPLDLPATQQGYLPRQAMAAPPAVSSVPVVEEEPAYFE